MYKCSCSIYIKKSRWLSSTLFTSHPGTFLSGIFHLKIPIYSPSLLLSCSRISELILVYWYHVTLHATPYWNSDPCSPLTHVHFQDLYLISITFLFSILTSNLDSVFQNSICLILPNPPHSMPVPVYPDRGFHNPISDLLIPLLRSWPCIVPSSY